MILDPDFDDCLLNEPAPAAHTTTVPRPPLAQDEEVAAVSALVLGASQQFYEMCEWSRRFRERMERDREEVTVHCSLVTLLGAL